VPHTWGARGRRYYPQYGDAWTCQDQCIVKQRFGEGAYGDQLYIGVFDGHGKPGEGELSSLMCKVRPMACGADENICTRIALRTQTQLRPKRASAVEQQPPDDSWLTGRWRVLQEQMHKKLAEEMEVDEHLRYVRFASSIQRPLARAPLLPAHRRGC
jgi:serine/threonine protein phosphatase PrpC